MKTVLILGGYGGVGSIIARLLLQETDSRVIIAGRNVGKAEEYARSFANEFPNRASARQVNADDIKSVESALINVDLVLVATASPLVAPEIARSTLQAGSDFLDIFVHQENYAPLKSMNEDIKRAGRVFITQAGFHPGLPAAFVRRGASYFDEYNAAIVSMSMNARFKSLESTRELINLARDADSEVFKDGSWKKVDYRDVITTDFGPPFGKRQCYPLKLEEMRPLPKMFGLKKSGVYVSGFNWVTDNLVFPLIIILHKIKKEVGTRFLMKFMYWSVNTFSPKEEHVTFVLEARGIKNGKPRSVRIAADHQDPYFFTAAPVVACLKQVFDRTIAPGLHLMGIAVDPDRVFTDMEKMGVRIKIEVADLENSPMTIAASKKSW